MLLIDCPWCGPRAEHEFRCGGESHIARPGPPETVADGEDYGVVGFDSAVRSAPNSLLKRECGSANVASAYGCSGDTREL